MMESHQRLKMCSESEQLFPLTKLSTRHKGKTKSLLLQQIIRACFLLKKSLILYILGLGKAMYKNAIGSWATTLVRDFQLWVCTVLVETVEPCTHFVDFLYAHLSPIGTFCPQNPFLCLRDWKSKFLCFKDVMFKCRDQKLQRDAGSLKRTF